MNEHYPATFHIAALAKIQTAPEPSNDQYRMFNTGGVEVEIGEFLHAFVRMIKPNFVLETGTHFGISSSYMGLALKWNGKGKMVTIDPAYYPEAKHMFESLDLLDVVKHEAIHAENYVCTEPIDFLFLDTEPKLRFYEFQKFWQFVRPGGFIAIHDLHPHLSYQGENYYHNGVFCWPYGDFRPLLGKYILEHEVQTMSFPTPRGFTFFQKRSDGFSYSDLITGKIQMPAVHMA